jgi:hypothetical protein
MYPVMFRWYLISLVICSSSKQVMMEFKVTSIAVKVDYTTEDEKYIFAENFMMQSL